jgi:phage-related baseplate assembly protein
MMDLAALPAPAVVEPLDFERILADIKADLLRRLPDLADALALESEPLVKLMEAFAYRELLYRARVNDAARAHLLAFAAGGDLDQLAALFGVVRQQDETDDRLRARLQLRIAALAGQGTREYYEYQAMTASSNVRAARADSPMPGSVRVVLWLADATVDSAPAVQAALNADGARMLGVPVTVGVARGRPIDVRARIWRTVKAIPGLADTLISRLQARLADLLTQQAQLGGVVSRSWFMAALHAEGVAAVEFLPGDAPPAAVQMGFDEYPALGQVDLIDAGAL